MIYKKFALIFSLLLFLGFAYLNSGCSLEPKIDYSTQVKPILNKHCIACHGGVKKQGGWSLLFEEEALAKAKSGKFAIVPGDAASSEMIKRIHHKDPEERMPYQKEPLMEDEILILTKWINQGAKWGEHWAYKSLVKQEVPSGSSDWIRNKIDNFILSKAKENGLETSKQADPITLSRRVSLDLVGFPLRNKAEESFIKNPSDKNYENYVDNLLSSPQFGEKWTSMWLDLARYADTKGYERDDSRNIWRYRDWLITAFNKDMPYNQFITEQLAGDLLPNPTENQYIATAFHRNSMTNDEGGTDNEEFRTAAVIDRVNTTWETLMGTTFACVQCHSHPYDPFKHNEYYKFMAFFNNTRDEDTFDDYPKIRHFDSTQLVKLYSLENWLGKNVNNEEKKNIINFIKTFQPSYNSLTCDEFVNAELSDTKWLAMRNHGVARLKNVNLGGKNSLMIRLKIYLPGGSLLVRKDNFNGEIVARIPVNKVKPEGGWQIEEVPLLIKEGKHNLFFTYQNNALTDPNKSGVQFDWFYFNEEFPKNKSPEYVAQKQNYWDLINASTQATPIMVENTNDLFRKTQVFNRGSWLSKGEEVSPNVPQLFGGLEKNAPKNRLGLANWMTSPKNPLVARTLVNRLWEQLFGVGLVETLEDLGSQGALPSHKELLDHLSYSFIHDYKWSVKRLLKEMVMSATYQQDSKISKEGLKKDPSNKFLARGPRVRLSAEQVRDQALAVCGVLSPKMYGKPVMPFQPQGIWLSPYNGAKWKKSEGEDQYRRAIYTFWKRTSPYPSMLSFDGVGREICASRRIRTNTPLQALVTLNDSVYIDLSKKLASNSFKFKQEKESIKKAYKMVTGKDISKEKLNSLSHLYSTSIAQYKLKPELARLLSYGRKEEEIISFAGMVLVCNSILNLDEVITKS